MQKWDPFEILHILQMHSKWCHFECIVFTITICITLRSVSQLIFLNKRKWLTLVQCCDISMLIHVSVWITSFISGSLMHMKSLTALFTVSVVEVMSRSGSAFELDSLSTVISSQGFTVLFLLFTSIWRCTRKRKKLRPSSRGSYSNHWNIGFNCVTLCFLNKGVIEEKVSERSSLKYKCFPNKRLKGKNESFTLSLGKHFNYV